MNASMSFPITMLLQLEGGTQTSGNDESKGQASFGIFDKISQSYLQFLKSASFFANTFVHIRTTNINLQ